MTVSPRRHSERAQLDPFEALSGDVPPRDQRDLMAHPFFSLSKSRRVAPIHYKAGDVELQVYAVAEHGMATIWDADVLIWAVSQILAAQDRGLPTSRFFRFTPYQLLNGIGRTTGARSYFLIKGALTRKVRLSTGRSSAAAVPRRVCSASWASHATRCTARHPNSPALPTTSSSTDRRASPGSCARRCSPQTSS
jgi:plasmid replication initiation protein